jgi:hypothetical protein
VERASLGWRTAKAANEGAPCVDPPDPPDPCATPLCKAGACVLEPLPDGATVDDGKPGDCSQSVCHGGAISIEPDDADVPPADACTTTGCKSGMPQSAPVNEGASCGVGTCCKGTCCADSGFVCVDDGCCFDLFVCDQVCCQPGETCCSGTCCPFGQTCNQGQCTP